MFSLKHFWLMSDGTDGLARKSSLFLLLLNSKFLHFVFFFFSLFFSDVIDQKPKRTIQRAKASSENTIQRNKEYFKPKTADCCE